ncbi:enoyl-CoA hydratase [Herbaspirillum lusitanum]|uniref:Enoyl-CoA hydratase n=1 Tax=Herbaspirillum lusitanum TaxID=213312 RepID=A0ABW9A7J8_9BURK
MDIQISKENGILSIAFDRESKKNALTAAMYQQLADALKDAQSDDAVRVILFTGKPQAFSAGNDLEDFLKNPPNSKDAPVFQFLWQISHAAKPIVAAVSGVAVGIGTTMLLHCDLVYAADNARFSMPFTQLGLCPEAASSMLLPELSGYQRAAEKLLLGEAFNVEEARDMGLVNRILPADELLFFAQKQAAKLAALPASSIRVTKQLMKKNRVSATEAQMTAEIEHFAAMLTAPEAKEAFTAFFEKRKPDFSRFS